MAASPTKSPTKKTAKTPAKEARVTPGRAMTAPPSKKPTRGDSKTRTASAKTGSKAPGQVERGAGGSPKAKKSANAKNPPAGKSPAPLQAKTITFDDLETAPEMGDAPAGSGDFYPAPPALAEAIWEPEMGLPGEPDLQPESESWRQPEAEPEPDLVAGPTAAPTVDDDWGTRIAMARAPPVHLVDPASEENLETSLEEDGAAGMEPQSPGTIQAPEGESMELPESGSARVVAQAGGGITIPEQFLMIAVDGQWDDRMERVKPGRMGAALAGSLLLELAILGKLRVQRNHFVIEAGSTGDADLDEVARAVHELGPIPTTQVIRRLGRGLNARIRPWKNRAARRGWLREDRRRFLGVLPRSTTYILDEGVQGKLQNRLVRMLAGGGNPDVRSIALLGLIQSAGLLPQLVPSAALPFNEKRIALLLSGRDPLHYRLDKSVLQVQDLALRTILADVRKFGLGQG